MALQRRFWKWPGISPSLPWFMVQLDTEPQQVSRAQGPCDTCSFREEGLLHHQGTSHQVFPHAKPKGSSHSSFTTTTTTITTTGLWKMSSWAPSLPLLNQVAKARMQIKKRFFDSLTDQGHDLAQVMPLLGDSFLRWVTTYQVAKYKHNFKYIKLSEPKYLRNYQNVTSLERLDSIPKRLSKMSVTL